MSDVTGVSNINAGNAGELSSMSLDAAYAAVMVHRNVLLDNQVRESLDEVNSQNQAMEDAQKYLAEAREAAMNSGDIVDEATWTVEGNTIQLDGGFSITLNNDGDATWTIHGPDGESTTVWGDPHVNESDESGQYNWDFKEDVTFVLGDGTKITVGTESKGSGMTFTDSLTITKGNQCIQVTGIKDGNVQINGPTLDGIAVDEATNDGTIIHMGDNAADWLTEGGEEIDSDQAMSDTQTINEMETDIPEMSDEMRQWMDANGIAYPPSEDGTYSPEEWQTIIKNIEGFNDSQSSISQLSMVELQSLMGKLQQGIEWQSNEISKFQGTSSSVVRNMA